MFIKIATVLTALVTALVLAAAPVKDGGTSGYPAPATETAAAPASVEAPAPTAPATATPVDVLTGKKYYCGRWYTLNGNTWCSYYLAADSGEPPVVLPVTPAPGVVPITGYPAP